jgi:hypothetical protein
VLQTVHVKIMANFLPPFCDPGMAGSELLLLLLSWAVVSIVLLLLFKELSLEDDDDVEDEKCLVGFLYNREAFVE